MPTIKGRRVGWFLPLLLVGFASVAFVEGQAVVNGGWSPWQVDPIVDCCVAGPRARHQRFCNNPSPENGGSLCLTLNGTYDISEESWQMCNCGCNPTCDPATSFCANDTGRPAFCQCNYGLVEMPNADPNAKMMCVSSDSLNVSTAAPVTAEAETIGTLDPDTKSELNMATLISIIILLACIGISFVVNIFMFGFKPLRFIQMNEEITLAITYVFVGFFIESTSDPDLCKAISAMVQYFFMCTMAFFCVEALNTYSLVTYVVPLRGYFNICVNLLLGYGVPLIPMAFSLGFLLDEYGSNGRHCWCDLYTDQIFAFLVPICIGAFVCTVVAEAQGQGQYKPLQNLDVTEYRSAKVSQYSIMFKMLLAAGSYISGMIAIDYQMKAVYIVFDVLTCLLGATLLISHIITSPNMAGVCPCGKNPMAKPPRRIAPTSVHEHPKQFQHT